jgi:hypothetical protein
MTAMENDLIERAGSGALNWLTIDEKNRIVIDQEGFRAYLETGAEAYIARRDELVAAFPRLPDIVDETTNGIAADYVGMILKCIKGAEAEREAVKAPFLTATRLIDGFYHTVTDSLGNAKGRDTVDQLRAKVETRMTAYQRAKAERERLAREAERKRQEEEAARLRAEAEERERQAQSEKDIDEAIQIDQQARQAEADASRAAKVAAAPLPELSRTRSDLGATAFLRTEWTFRDLRRDKLDLETLRAHLPADALQQAVRSFIRAGGRKLDGVEIYEDSRTQVRA